jgi:hypothetical protein
MSRIIIGLCAFVMLVITPSVKADPIVITSGSLTVTGIAGSPTYSISGMNFSVTSVGGDSGNTPNCLPCLPGQLANVSSFLVGSSLGHGPATINGVSFPELFYSGTFNLGATVLLPVGGTTDLTLTTPFTFIGSIRGCEAVPKCVLMRYSARLNWWDRESPRCNSPSGFMSRLVNRCISSGA